MARRGVLLVAGLVSLAGFATRGAGAPAGLPDGSPAWVYESADVVGVAPDGTAYLSATSLVAVTGATPVVRVSDGTTDASWPQIAGASAAASDGHGGYYVSVAAGAGRPAATVRHVLADHSVDARFAPRFDREPSAIVTAGGAVVVAGSFHTVDGQGRGGLAELDATTGAPLPWDPAPDGAVLAVADGGDGTLYLAGAFNHVAGAARSGLAQLTISTGGATPWNPAPPVTSGSPQSLAVTATTVVMGGEFLWFEPHGEIEKLVAVDRASGAVTRIGPTDSIGILAADGEVSAVAVVGGTLYAGGSFTQIGADPRAGVAAFDLATGRLLPFAPPDDSAVRYLVASPTGVIVAAEHLRRLDPGSGAVLPFAPIAGPGQPVLLGDELLVVESDTRVGLGTAGGLAAIAPDGHPLSSFSAPAGIRYARALRAGDALLAFGCPRHGCGAGAAGIARAILRLDPATGAQTGWRAHAAWPRGVSRRYGWLIAGEVADAATLDVLVHFLPAGSDAATASAIESFDLRSGRLVGLALQRPTGAPVIATALARSGRWLILAGLSDARGRALARLDPRTLRLRPWRGAARLRGFPGQPAEVDQLAAVGGRLYLLGSFSAVSGAARPSHVAAVSAGSGRVLPFAPRLGPRKFAASLVACPGFVAITGGASGAAQFFDAVVDPRSGRPLAWDHARLVGSLFAGPAGLLTGAVAGERAGVALFRGALGACSPS